MNIEEITLILPNKIGIERVARECSSSYAKILGFEASKIEDIKTAVTEACLNAIEHGNRGNIKAKVSVNMSFDGRGLIISVRDEGKGILHKVKKPNIDYKIKGLEKIRGFGIFLIENLMDKVSFEKSDENGHIVKMVKYLE